MNTMFLNLIVLRTDKMTELVAFYEALGLSFVQEQHGTGLTHFSCELGATIFEIYPASEKQTTSSTRIGFAVRDLERSCQMAGRLGRIVKPPTQGERGYHAVVQDPGGHKVELLQVS